MIEVEFDFPPKAFATLLRAPTPITFPDDCPATILPTEPTSTYLLFLQGWGKPAPRLGLDLSGVQKTGKGPRWHYSEDSRSTMSVTRWPLKRQFCLKAVFLATPSSEAHCFMCTDYVSDWLALPPLPRQLLVLIPGQAISGPLVWKMWAKGQWN